MLKARQPIATRWDGTKVRHRQAATERPSATPKAVCRERPRPAARGQPTATPAVGYRALRGQTPAVARPIVIQWDAYRGQPLPIPPVASPSATHRAVCKGLPQPTPPAASPIATHKVAYKDRRSKDGTVRCNRPDFPHCILSATRVLFCRKDAYRYSTTRCPHKVSPIILSAKNSTPSHPIPAYPVPIAHPCFISSATHLQNQSTA